MKPVDVTAKAVAAHDLDSVFVAAVFFGHPEVRNALNLGNFTLNQITIKFGFGLSTTGAAISVIESTLKQKSVVRLVHEKLPCRLAVIERFRIVRVRGSENDESHVVARVAGTATVVVAINDVEGVAGSHSVTALISFRITHCQEMCGIKTHEELEVNLFGGKLVGELREEVLELTARAQIRDAERIANCLENPAPFFTRSVGLEEANSAFNQVELIAVSVQFSRIQNGMSEVVNERVVRIVRFGSVDDNGLQIFIPRLRFAEEFAKGAFAVDRIDSEAIDELFGDVFVNVVRIRMTKIILKSSPDVIAKLFFKFIHN